MLDVGSHGALSLGHYHRRAYRRILLDCWTALTGHSCLAILPRQRAARTSSSDDAQTGVQHRRTHCHRHRLNALAGPMLSGQSANTTLIDIAYHRLKLKRVIHDFRMSIDKLVGERSCGGSHDYLKENHDYLKERLEREKNVIITKDISLHHS